MKTGLRLHLRDIPVDIDREAIIDRFGRCMRKIDKLGSRKRLTSLNVLSTIIRFHIYDSGPSRY